MRTTAGSSQDANLYIRGARTAGQTLTSNIFFQNNGNTDKDLASIQASNADGNSSTSNGRIQFRTNNGSGLNTALTILDTGNLEATGTITAATPTANNHLTTKAYVDSAVTTSG